MFGQSQHFTFVSPTTIEFGWGALAKLPQLLRGAGGSRPLVVGDPGIERAGLLGRVLDVLERAKITATPFIDVESDPDVRSVLEGVRVAKETGCDSIVAVGGGSAIDAAKGIGLLLTNGGRIADYSGIGKVKVASCPLVAIPTTAGTGSELTIWSVLSDRETGEKFGVGSLLICPRFAVLDPELTLMLPASVTAATGMDALTHAIESLVCTATNPFSAAPAEKAIALIGDNLRLAVAHGGNGEARANMLIASALAGMAFNNTRLGYVHALAMPLGAKFKIPHGLVNAITLPHVMQFNLPGNFLAYARIAMLLGERIDTLSMREAAERSVAAVKMLKQDIGIDQTLVDFGVMPDHYDAIIEEALKSGNCPVNPRQGSRSDLRGILHAARGDSVR